MPEVSAAQHRFDVLYGTLCEAHSGLTENTEKVTGFLLLAAGWIATSDSTRKFLAADRYTRYLAVISLAGAFGLYVAASVKAYLISRDSFKLLNELDFMPKAYYQIQRVDRSVLCIFIGGNLFVFGLLAGLVLRAGLIHA